MIKKLSSPFKNLFARIAASSNSLMYFLIGLVVVVGPLFFVPVSGFAVGVSKGFFVGFLAIIGLLIAGISVLKKGGVTFPRHPLFLIMGGIWLFGLIGSFFAPSTGMSLLGYGFETTTWLFVTVFGLFMLLAYKTISDYQRVGILYGGIMVAFVILFVIQIVRFIAGPGVLSFGVLGSSTSTLIGSWGDLGIFFGLVLLFSTTTLQLAGLTRMFRWIVLSVAALSAIMLAFMNIGTIWIVLGLVALLFMLYLFAFAYWDTSSKSYKKENRVPWYVLSLFVLSIACIFFGGILNGFADRHQNISWNDVRPSLGTTVSVMEKSLAHNFATGYGPNTFSLGWSLSKPPALSSGTLAGTDFNLGFGYVFTQIAMNGLAGAILWILFFGLLVYLVIRRMGQGFESALDRYFVISISMVILYLSIIAWVYVPGSYLLILLALFIGAFAKISVAQKNVSVSFIKDPRASFFGILGVTAMVLLTLVAGYVGIRKVDSFVHYARANAFIAQSNLSAAVTELGIATSLAPHDLYHVKLAQLALADASRIASSANSQNKDAVSKQAEQSLGIALGNAKAATAENPSSYKNWILLGNVYQAAVSLGVTDASDLAKAAYGEAQKRDPRDSTIALSFANLALANKDTAGALQLIQSSIDAYPTKEAYLLRAQIQYAANQNSDALTSVGAALSLDPYNADISYQYGLLAFQSGDYKSAIQAFQRTIAINNSYGIAFVYLGVSYERIGDLDSANKVYDYIRKQSADADTIISQVKNGGTAPAATPAADATATPAAPLKPAAKTPVAPKTKK